MSFGTATFNEKWRKGLDPESSMKFMVTKADKVSRTKRPERFREIAQVLELPADTPFFPTSATGREGVGDLHAWVQALLTGAEQEEAER